MEIIYKHKIITIREVWLDENVGSQKYDKAIYYRSQVRQEGISRFWTLLINLTQEEDVIWSAFKKNTKQQIRKALSENNFLVKMYHDSLDDSIFSQYICERKTFTKERELSHVSISTFNAYKKNGILYISNIADIDGKILVWHTYIVIGERVIILTSNSFFESTNKDIKNLVGRANRLLHWKDMLYFKEKGYKIYDFGGWYDGNENKKMSGINRFKESFGGEKEYSYTYSRCMTFKCHLFYTLVKIKQIIVRLMS